WRVPNLVGDRSHRSSGFASGPLIDLRWSLRPDPTVESLAVYPPPGAPPLAGGGLWLERGRGGIEGAGREARGAGRVLCCARVEFAVVWFNERWRTEETMVNAGRYPVSLDFFADLSQSEHWRAEGHQCRLLAPPPPAWLTADVTGLARALLTGVADDGLL